MPKLTLLLHMSDVGWPHTRLYDPNKDFRLYLCNKVGKNWPNIMFEKHFFSLSSLLRELGSLC